MTTAVLLTLLGALSRLLPHPPNAVALGALALYSGAPPPAPVLAFVVPPARRARALGFRHRPGTGRPALTCPAGGLRLLRGDGAALRARRCAARRARAPRRALRRQPAFLLPDDQRGELVGDGDVSPDAGGLSPSVSSPRCRGSGTRCSRISPARRSSSASTPWLAGSGSRGKPASPPWPPRFSGRNPASAARAQTPVSGERRRDRDGRSRGTGRGRLRRDRRHPRTDRARGLEDRLGRSCARSERRRPGSGGPGLQTSVFLRGSKPRRTPWSWSTGSASIRRSSPGYDFALLTTENVERIEVVRGPFSALYGSDAIGGVVQIFTRPAAERLSGQVSAEAGNARQQEETAFATAGHGPWSAAERPRSPRRRGSGQRRLARALGLRADRRPALRRIPHRSQGVIGRRELGLPGPVGGATPHDRYFPREDAHRPSPASFQPAEGHTASVLLGWAASRPSYDTPGFQSADERAHSAGSRVRQLAAGIDSGASRAGTVGWWTTRRTSGPT